MVLSSIMPFTVYEESHFSDLPDGGAFGGDVQNKEKPGKQTHIDSNNLGPTCLHNRNTSVHLQRRKCCFPPITSQLFQIKKRKHMGRVSQGTSAASRTY